MQKQREKLPYRETTICFVILDGKIICKVGGNGQYIKYPGGGVDEGESPEKAVKRELLEELQIGVKKLTRVGEISADWHPEWTENDPKRIERYKQFRGEKTYVFIAFFDKEIKYKSNECDQWIGGVKKYLKTPKFIIDFVEKSLPKIPPNFLAFTKTQIAILNTIKLFISIK